MESNGVYSNALGLEMSLHHPLQQRNPHPMDAYGGGDYHHLQNQQSAKQGYPRSKNQSLNLSDDDEPGLTAENSADDGKRKMSPWQRMKWTDNMVRLLIMVVYYIGDEAGSDANDPVSKKKGGGSGALQKKGKWKSVSRAMMERGFYVSPQQCEDKFNDLNKRYKRVNDILGKGTSCKVVENQSLLDNMDHISGKMKDEVKKLLNSKHLFFREMCAYHNSCGHAAVETAPPPPQRCLHSSEKSPVTPNLNRGESKLGKTTTASVEDDDDEEEDGNDDDDEEDGHDDDDDVHDEDIDDRSSAKRMRRTPSFQQLDGEITSILRDGSKSGAEKRMWVRTKMMGLEEQRIGIQTTAFELEKQRLKWLKFSRKKEREMEREKLMNERLRLENERMVLLIRRKELDLLDHQYSSTKRTETG